MLTLFYMGVGEGKNSPPILKSAVRDIMLEMSFLPDSLGGVQIFENQRAHTGETIEVFI